MRSVLPIFLFLAVLAGCGSTQTSRVRDILQIRPLEEDDPLAARLADRKGDLVRVGDVVINDYLVQSLFFKPGENGTFDLSIFLTDYGAAKWKNLLVRRVPTVVLVIEGKVYARFTPAQPVNKSGTNIIVPGLASTQEEADALQKIFDRKRTE
ncbi:MAG: hypothetical protein QHI48_01445 [Bacteroidota bacterium]|nr:hypothetical protein [Bacteroidota bacterium]